MEQITATITINAYGKEYKKEIAFIPNRHLVDGGIFNWLENIFTPFHKHDELIEQKKRAKEFINLVKPIIADVRHQEQDKIDRSSRTDNA